MDGSIGMIMITVLLILHVNNALFLCYLQYMCMCASYIIKCTNDQNSDHYLLSLSIIIIIIDQAIATTTTTSPSHPHRYVCARYCLHSFISIYYHIYK